MRRTKTVATCEMNRELTQLTELITKKVGQNKTKHLRLTPQIREGQASVVCIHVDKYHNEFSILKHLQRLHRECHLHQVFRLADEHINCKVQNSFNYGPKMFGMSILCKTSPVAAFVACSLFVFVFVLQISYESKHFLPAVLCVQIFAMRTAVS